MRSAASTGPPHRLNQGWVQIGGTISGSPDWPGQMPITLALFLESARRQARWQPCDGGWRQIVRMAGLARRHHTHPSSGTHGIPQRMLLADSSHPV